MLIISKGWWVLVAPCWRWQDLHDQPSQAFVPQDLGSRFALRFLVARAIEINSMSPKPEEISLRMLRELLITPSIYIVAMCTSLHCLTWERAEEGYFLKG